MQYASTDGLKPMDVFLAFKVESGSFFDSVNMNNVLRTQYFTQELHDICLETWGVSDNESVARKS